MQDRLFESIADVCGETGTPEPGGFLAEVMSGVDPRPGRSRVGAILDEIRDRGPGYDYPTPEEWAELADLLARHPAICREYVDLNTSVTAAKQLLPYLYSARRAEPDPADGPSVPDTVTALTAEEIELFAEYWDEQY